MHMPLGYAKMRVAYDPQGKPADYLLEEYNPAVEQILHVQLTGMVGRSIREPGFLKIGRASCRERVSVQV